MPKRKPAGRNERQSNLPFDSGQALSSRMPKAAMIAIGVVVPLLVILFHPFEGNTLGFCPVTKSPLHAANDVVVAAIDVSALWMIYRGLRR